MKKPINEPDYVGGQGSLTKEEENELSQYFSKKKADLKKEQNDYVAQLDS